MKNDVKMKQAKLVRVMLIALYEGTSCFGERELTHWLRYVSVDPRWICAVPWPMVRQILTNSEFFWLICYISN